MTQSSDTLPQSFSSTALERTIELPEQLRHYLQGRLPEYMVPSFFVLLEDLPMTSSGKINYQALPAPNEDRLEPYFAPQTTLEKSLAEIWVQTLKLKQVGLSDNFFQVGGHSLVVTQVVAHIRRILQIELPLRVLFEKPTIAELAEYIETSILGK
ncbi:MAG: phosphopantetheine-binding protein [Ktedonobacteraceae bacterium]